YHFVSWSDSVSTASRTDSNVTGNITVSASFAINSYSLAYTAGSNGSLTGSASQTVNHGVSGTAVTAVPASGYHFVSWSDSVSTASRTDSNVTGNITVSASFAISKLNDTGITTCSDETTNGLACPQATHPGQDAEFGRDVTHNDNSDGHAGFSFTKISSSGAFLAASATQWNCVKDNVTGLMWEVKTDDNGLHDKDWSYTWYEPDNSKNGGNAGTQTGVTAACGNTGSCNTAAYVQAVNAEGWCGANDWRMPTRDELSGIAALDRVNPSIDTAYVC
ncbi:MAG: DUF1566 domain-containing protein, partial [Methylococcales bacterium]|nr:DUF1566 domain-containing protein [Methylococcales bacterium]